MTTQFFGKNLLIVAAVAVLLVIGSSALYAPDRRSGGQKISDAIDALPDGVDKAARQLEDRTPADKINDAAKDAGDAVK
jgi:hypothetical protein